MNWPGIQDGYLCIPLGDEFVGIRLEHVGVALTVLVGCIVAVALALSGKRRD